MEIQMKVKLVSYTSDAKNLLIFTKNTRLFDSEDSYGDVSSWPEKKKQDELDYMLKTIKSSWEFIDYTFFGFSDIAEFNFHFKNYTAFRKFFL